jgi:subtilisin family serine protease
MASVPRARLVVTVLACLMIGTLVLAPGGSPPVRAEDAPSPAYFSQQWNLKAIGIEQAWAEGEFGSRKVRVAILDTGIDYLHPDLVGRVDLKDSISLVSSQPVCEPGDPGTPSVTGPTGEDALAAAATPAREPFHDFHSHGTAVAGLVVSNGLYLAGVTRDTTLIAIKVHDRTRRNCLSVYLEGIDEAVKRGADVIHMSFPLEFPKADFPGAEARINEVMERAHRKGAVLIAAAGNAADELTPDGAQFRFCMAAHVICVSATGPTTANPDPDRSADYTNFGVHAIDVAGPGGSGTANPTIPPSVTADKTVWLHCSRLVIAPGRPCALSVPSTATEKLAWQSVGTSFGAAATSGLAALVVSIIGPNRPDDVERVLLESAEDVTDVADSTRDEAGPDPYYGRGRIDVAAAIELARTLALEE